MSEYDISFRFKYVFNGRYKYFNFSFLKIFLTLDLSKVLLCITVFRIYVEVDSCVLFKKFNEFLHECLKYYKKT